jgi:hypothetical protein
MLHAVSPGVQKDFLANPAIKKPSSKADRC